MIEVGEYVRTDKGYIFKVDKEKVNLNIVNFLDVEYGDIIKHSKNIIDLLQEGDIVNGFSIGEFYDENENKYLGIPIYDDAQLDCIGEVRPIDSLIITTILTKEQYEKNCYTVERKE